MIQKNSQSPPNNIVSSQEDDHADARSFNSNHNQDAFYLDSVVSMSVQPTLPPTGQRRKPSSALSFHEHVETVGFQKQQSSYTSKSRNHTEATKKHVKEDDGQTSSREGTVDHDQSSLGISAIERQVSDSYHETAYLFMLPRRSVPEPNGSHQVESSIVPVEGTREMFSSVVPTQSQSPAPHKSEFDPIDSFLSNNRSRGQSRTQSFDFHQPAVTSISAEREGQVDLFLLASQNLDDLFSAPTEEEVAEYRQQDELIAALKSPLFPTTPVGKPPFSPF
jgi:hypothetical protein